MHSPEQRAKLLKRATYASVAVSTTLFLSKIVVWYLSGSVAVLASLVDSLMDIAASGINLIAVRLALLPPDQDHRFGHGKAEALAGLAQAAFITGSALFLFLHAINHIVNPEIPKELDTGLMVMGLSITLTLGLVLYQRYVVSQTQSLAIKADSAHYITDLGTNLLVVFTLIAVQALGPNWAILDPLCGLLLSFYIFKSAYEIAQGSIAHLMDHELPAEERTTILEIASSQDGVLGLHDFRTRQAGHTKFIQIHLELSDDLSLIDAHNIGEAVEENIEREFPGAEIIVHLDPLSVIPHDKRNSVQEPGTRSEVLAAPMFGAHSGNH